jgi:hypothetical protein
MVGTTSGELPEFRPCREGRRAVCGRGRVCSKDLFLISSLPKEENHSEEGRSVRLPCQ